MKRFRQRPGMGAAAIVALIAGLVIGAAAVAIVEPGLVTTMTTTQTNTITGTTTVGVTSTVTNTLTSTMTNTVTSTATSTTTTTKTTTVTNGNSSLPALPSPVGVSVDPKTTALLVLDYVFCYRMTGCNATLPAVGTLLSKARAAGALVIFTRVPVPKEIANQTGETIITNDVSPDKYYNTSLASILQSHGIKTVVVTGIAPNGALLYTAQESCVRKLTVVVAADTLFGTPYVQSYVPFQLLNGPGCSNANNTPLTAGRATLSTTSLITFAG